VTSPSSGSDPVLARRAQIARVVALGQRVGYTLFGIACVVFFAGFGFGFHGWVVDVIVVSLVAGSLILAPAIVFGYGVKAADRADREGTWGDPNP
jgi:hypothetical protein